jgi:hypothetical protein
LSPPDLPLTGPRRQGMRRLPVLTTILLSFETMTSSSVHSLPTPTRHTSWQLAVRPANLLLPRCGHDSFTTLGLTSPPAHPPPPKFPLWDTPHHHPFLTVPSWGTFQQSLRGTFTTRLNSPPSLPWQHPPPTSPLQPAVVPGPAALGPTAFSEVALECPPNSALTPRGGALGRETMCLHMC